MNTLSVSAPGRICLFGEHQDYLGLPVIAAAINLVIGCEAARRSDRLFAISLPDTGEQVTLDPTVDQVYAHGRDYLRSAINILRRKGLTWPNGYDITVHGNIPINAGVSSSSAMVVMWLRFLLATSEPRLEVTPDDLARLAYRTEVAEFGEPGGMMDHYCAALGGVLRIDTVPPFAAERWDVPLTGFVLGHSLEPKATIETLGRIRADVTEGIRLIRERMQEFDLHNTPLADAELHLTAMPPDPARRLRANLVNRDLTIEAAQAIRSLDQAAIGRLLSAHHAQLRDGLDLSTPKIERMMNASLAAGALGGKINGSGGGGCMFAYAPGAEEAVAAAIKSEGGVPYVVDVAR